MALEFIDSMSHSGTATAQIEVARKWTTYQDAFYASTPNRRAGQVVIALGTISKTLSYQNNRTCGCAYYFPNSASIAQGLIEFGAGNQQLAYVSIELDRTLSIYTGVNNIRIWNSGSSFVLTTDVFHYFEFQVQSGGGSPVSVTCSLMVDGSSLINLVSGNTGVNANQLLSGTNQMNTVTINGPVGGSFTSYVCDLYVLNSNSTDINGFPTSNTTFLGDVSVDALIPIQDVTVQWQQQPSSPSGSYLLVDEIPPDDDTTYVFTDTVGQVETFKFQQLVGFTGTIFGAQLLLYAKKDAEGSRSIAGLVGGNVVNNLYGNQSYLYDYYDYFIYPLDSDNGTAWTPAVYNAENFGAKLSA